MLTGALLLTLCVWFGLVWLFPSLVGLGEMPGYAIFGMLSSGGFWLGNRLWLRKKFDPENIRLRAADVFFRGIDPGKSPRRPPDDA